MCRPGRHLSRIDSRVLGGASSAGSAPPPPSVWPPATFFGAVLAGLGAGLGLLARVRRAAFGDGCMSVCETAPWLPGTLAARFSIYLW